MKIKLLLITFLILSRSFVGKTQIPSSEDSSRGFSMEEMNHHLKNFKGTLEERNKRIERSKNAFIERKYKLGAYAPPKINKDRIKENPSVDALYCTNIGFDLGDTRQILKFALEPV
jgi:hypothetical protein